jgi:iron transport multicopper oxidase
MHLALLALQVLAVSAKIVTYNWDVDWVSVSPDGIIRPAVGINGQWPCPPINADVGDRVIINLKNNLHNETTSIHFHGIYQKGSNQMDGPAMVTQCPVPPGSCKIFVSRQQNNLADHFSPQLLLMISPYVFLAPNFQFN